ncbi:MAG: hypothetical protein HOI70_12855, partial [Opitutae bacterium]|nr:hypothetical protein [Opitutae bacterium]
SMDEPNLIPMFNSYAWSATLAKTKHETVDEKKPGNLPCERKEPFRKNFKEAGIFVDRGHDHYSIINYKKGGVVYHFNQKKLNFIDSGVVIRSSSGNLGSNHSFEKHQTLSIKDNRVFIKQRISAMPKKLSSPLKFLVLRILCFTVFRSSSIREFTKRLLVKYLITKPKPWPIWNVREILLGENLKIIDQCDLKVGYNKLLVKDPFVPIHMASKGYWQIQDEKA